VLEDPDLLNRATTSFKELKFPRGTEDPSENKTGDGSYVLVLDESNQNAMETVMAEGHGICEINCLFSNNFKQIIDEFDDFYGLWEELDVQPLQDSRWIMDNSSQTDRASILAETIAYLKELERRVKELESRRERMPQPGKSFTCHEREFTRKRFPVGAKSVRWSFFHRLMV
ncbi:hypothetical protein EJB05_38422, partial [Eragrostis curvula]